MVLPPGENNGRNRHSVRGVLRSVSALSGINFLTVLCSNKINTRKKLLAVSLREAAVVDLKMAQYRELSSCHRERDQ